jgi:phage terminase large subunit GpA-like protein
MNKLNQFACEVFAPPESMSVAEWAEKFVYIPKEVTPYAGYFRAGFNRYLVEPLNQFGEKRTNRLTICFASQTGKTTLMHIGLIYVVTKTPKPVLYLMPSDQSARQISKERIQPMMRASAEVAKILPDNPDNFSILSYQLKTTNVHLGGAGSASKLASFPCAVVCFDECDKAEVRNKNEAGAIQLASNRIKAYGSSKLFVLASTPTIDDGAETITHHLKQSTFKTYRVPCVECGELAEIGFGKDEEKFSVEWDRVEVGGVLDITATAESSRLVCPYCSHQVKDDATKNKMVSSDEAKWIATNPLADESHQGYHLNSLYSSYISIKDACRMFLEAKETNQLQDFRNSFQALPWRHDTEELPDIVKLKELEGEYSRGEIPPDAFVLLTCDVQKYEFYWMVTAHDFTGTTFIVDHGRADNFGDLEKIFNHFQVDYAGVDSAYNTGFVLSNIRRLGKKWFAIRGQQSLNGQLNIVQVNPLDGRTDKSASVTRFDINNTHFKRLLVRMRNQAIAGLSIYRDADTLLYRHLLAEVETEKKDRNGRIVYEFKQIDRENHWFDCLNYALGLKHFFQKTKSFARVDRPANNYEKPNRRPLSERVAPEEM